MITSPDLTYKQIIIPSKGNPVSSFKWKGFISEQGFASQVMMHAGHWQN